MKSRSLDRISVDPSIRFGKPRVKGTRITVEEVLQLVNAGIPFTQIVTDYYPALTVDDIHACLEYAIALVASEDIDLVAAT